MQMFLLVIGVILLSAAIILAYRPVVPAAVVAYAALWSLRQSGFVNLSAGAMLYWGIAVIIVLLLDHLQPDTAHGRGGLAYICTGILAGVVLGFTIAAQAGTIIGAAAGAVIGAVAYRRTPSGTRITEHYARHCLRLAVPALIALVQLGPVLQSLTSQASVQ